jgi:uncharacterized lipoprotein YehR (DUF1307 family)
MRAIILGLVIALAGCGATTPVKRNFPDAIPELQEKCPTLATVEGTNIAITDLLKTVIKTMEAIMSALTKLTVGTIGMASKEKSLKALNKHITEQNNECKRLHQIKR